MILPFIFYFFMFFIIITQYIFENQKSHIFGFRNQKYQDFLFRTQNFNIYVCETPKYQEFWIRNLEISKLWGSKSKNLDISGFDIRFFDIRFWLLKKMNIKKIRWRTKEDEHILVIFYKKKNHYNRSITLWIYMWLFNLSFNRLVTYVNISVCWVN